MESKNYITNNYIKEIEHSEIDFDLYDKILGKDWDYLDLDKEEIELGSEDKRWSREGYPIEIDRLIKTLESLKDNGANFVEIMYHCDHIGYVFNGVDIHKSTKEEIEAHLEKVNKQKEKSKQKEIESLEMKLKQLKS